MQRRVLVRVPLDAVALLDAAQVDGAALLVGDGDLLQDALLEVELPKAALGRQQCRQVEPVFDCQFHVAYSLA